MHLRIYTAKLVRTMNPSFPTANAVAVADGQIVEVGTLESMQPWLDAHTHEIDETFADKVLMPGFIDPHLHPSLSAMLLPMHFITAMEWKLPDRTVPPTTTPEDYLAELQRIESEMATADEPLHTWGYHNLWHGEVNRQMLDAISTTRPIIVWQRSFHEIYVNTPGLDWSGLDLDRIASHPQVDLEEGRFSETGKNIAMAQMNAYLLAEDRFRLGLDLTAAAVHQGGQTTIGDLTGGLLDTDNEWDAMCAALDRPEVPFRVQMIPAGIRGTTGASGIEGGLALVKHRAERGTQRLFYRNNVKLFTDGGFYAQLMQVGGVGFIDGHHGEWLMPPELFEQLARMYWNAGYQIHVHCTGDLGVELALDTLAKLQWERPRFDHRFTIEHFGLSTPEQVRRIADLGAIVSANIYYVHELGEAYWAGSVGYERASQMARVGSLERHGVTTAYHSDFTMAPCQPLVSAWVAVNRVGESGAVMGAEERASIDAAMRAITIDAAYVLGMESEIGSISSGKKADFTVLDEDPYEVDPMRLKDINIWGTVFEGHKFPLATR